jgi:hypothetical protein
MASMTPAGFRRNPALIAFKSPCLPRFRQGHRRKRAKTGRFPHPPRIAATERMVYMRTIVGFAIVRRSIAEAEARPPSTSLLSSVA